MVAGILGLLALAAIVALAAWAIADMRSTKRFDGRPRQGTGASLGDAFLEVQALLEPDKRHVIEERRAEPREGDESGGPPPGRSRDPGEPA